MFYGAMTTLSGRGDFYRSACCCNTSRDRNPIQHKGWQSRRKPPNDHTRGFTLTIGWGLSYCFSFLLSSSMAQPERFCQFWRWWLIQSQHSASIGDLFFMIPKYCCSSIVSDIKLFKTRSKFWLTASLSGGIPAKWELFYFAGCTSSQRRTLSYRPVISNRNWSATSSPVRHNVITQLPVAAVCPAWRNAQCTSCNDDCWDCYFTRHLYPFVWTAFVSNLLRDNALRLYFGKRLMSVIWMTSSFIAQAEINHEPSAKRSLKNNLAFLQVTCIGPRCLCHRNRFFTLSCGVNEMQVRSF